MVYWAGLNKNVRERMYDSIEKTRRVASNWVKMSKGKNRTIPIYKSKDSDRSVGILIYWYGSIYWVSNNITPRSDFRYYEVLPNGQLGPKVSLYTARMLEDEVI